MNGFNFFNVLESLPGSVVQLDSGPSDWKVTDSYPILSLRKFPCCIPIKIEKSTAVIENQKARGGRWEEGKGGSLRPFLSFPFPSCPARLFPLLPSLRTTQRGLCGRREYPISDFLLPTSQPAHLCKNSVVSHYFSFSLILKIFPIILLFFFSFLSH